MESNVVSFGEGEKAMEELSSGYECAKQLIAILQQHKAEAIASTDGLISSNNQSTKDLLEKILESLDSTISTLTTSKSTSSSSSSSSMCYNVESDEVVFLPQSESQWQSPVPEDSICCHKKQRSSEKWTEESSMLADDGHAWRKYGQKQIRDGKYPRDYFRCTYMFDQHCQAAKQVQQIHDNPPKYRITYFGHHTCKKIQTPPRILSCDIDDEDYNSSIWLNFETTNIKRKKQKNDQIPPPMFPSPATEHQFVVEDIQNSKLKHPTSFDMLPEDVMSIFDEFDVPIMSPRMSVDIDIDEYMMDMNFEELLRCRL